MTDTLQPLGVTVIGTGDGGHITDGTTALTPSNQPNLVVTVIGPLLAIGVRFGNLYLTLLSGLLVAGMTTNILPMNDFMDLLWTCAKLSISGAVLGLIKDVVTIFGKLESRFPLLTGSV